MRRPIDRDRSDSGKVGPMSVYFENHIDLGGELRPPLFLRVPEIQPLLDGGPHALQCQEGAWFWGSEMIRVGPFLDIGLASAAADMAVLHWLSDNGFHPQLFTGGLGPDGNEVGYNVKLWIDGPRGATDPFFAKTRAEVLNIAAHEAQTHLLASEEM